MKKNIIKLLVYVTIIVITYFSVPIYDTYNKHNYLFVKNCGHLSYKLDKEGNLYVTGNLDKVNPKNSMLYTDCDVSGWISPMTQRVVVDLGDLKDTGRIGTRLKRATSFDFSKTDMTHLEYTDESFIKCISLKTIDISDWDVSNVKKTTDMFLGCTSLEDIKGLDELSFDSCYVYANMFSYCENLKNIKMNGKLNQSDDDSISFYETFYGCKKLEVIDLSDFDFSILYTEGMEGRVTKVFKNAFEDCESLQKIIANDTFKIVEENYEGELPKVEYVNN